MLPVAFVHGLIGSLDDDELIASFSPRSVIAPDLLGYGSQNDAAPEQIDIDSQVVELTRVLDAAGVEQVHLVGHSVGGVIGTLFCARNPERVATFVSVEGNFSLSDAFWSERLARLPAEVAERELAQSRADPATWLREASVEINPRTIALAERWLHFQPASTVQAMAASVVELTGDPEYQAILRSVLHTLPVYLVSGELSRDGWHVPDWALAACESMTLLSGGHLMMVDNTEIFARSVNELISRKESRDDSS
jgi:pimeloyl-ACP methyl ester carboxylesterase